MGSAAKALVQQEIDTLQQLRIERARRGMLNFICYTKPDYEPIWYHRLICRELNKVVSGDTKRLIITMPPRHGKTEAVSVRLPAFLLGVNPNAQIICATYNADYAKKINRDVQRAMEDPLYKELFPGSQMNNKNVRTVAGAPIRNSDMFELLNPAKGFYKSTSIGGPLTGFGADVLICDDYCKNYEVARSVTYQESTWSWWLTTMTTRALPGAAIIICATRWTEGDLIGRVLEQQKAKDAAQWTVLNLPAVCETPKHPDDPRAEGDALWPQRYDLKWLRAKRSEGERTFISMYQQRPAPQEGNIIRMSWWRYWTTLPDEFDLIGIAIDPSNNNETGREDFTVMTVWGRSGPNLYMLDMARDRMEWRGQKAAVLRVINTWSDFNDMWVENTALGPALISELRKIVPGIHAVTPRGSKVSRLEAVSGLIEAGNVFLPDPETTGLKFAETVTAELGVFPNGKHDDIVDSVSMALSKMRPSAQGVNFNDVMVEKESMLAGLYRVDG